MNLPTAKSITFRSGSRSITIPEPSVQQIQIMLEREPDDPESESQAARSLRSLQQCRDLCLPVSPGMTNPMLWIQWLWRYRRIKRWVDGLSYPAVCIVLNTMTMVSQGLDVQSLTDLEDRLQQDAKKKAHTPSGEHDQS